MRNILIMSIGSGLGGIEQSMIDFLKYLSLNKDLNIDLYLWRSPGPLYSAIPSNINIITDNYGIRGIRQCVSFHDFFQYFSFRFLNIFGLGTKIMKRSNKKYDTAIAYCQVGYTPYYIIDKVIAKKKYLFYHHGSYEGGMIRRIIDNIYFSRYCSILTMSKSNVFMLKNVFPHISDKLSVCSPLIDKNKIITKAKEQNSDQILETNLPLLVTVARLSEEKGIFKALQAAAKMKENGINFIWIFIGSGAERSKYDKYITENHIDDRCFLMGRRDNPYIAMSKSTIYVQPSDVESFSLTIREAAVFGVPIIASDIPALREASEDINNIIYTSNHPKYLAETIKNILEDTDGLKSGKYNTDYRSFENHNAVMQIKRLFE